MTKYFIKRGDFSNQYSLAYTTDGTEPKGWERITREQAETMARDEDRRRREEPSFSGYADSYVWPYNMDGMPGVSQHFTDADQIIDWARYNQRGYSLSGKVVVFDGARA